jgi:hypothetical protein
VNTLTVLSVPINTLKFVSYPSCYAVGTAAVLISLQGHTDLQLDRMSGAIASHIAQRNAFHLFRHNGKFPLNTTHYLRLVKNNHYVMLRRAECYTATDVSEDCCVFSFTGVGLLEREDGYITILRNVCNYLTDVSA